MARNPEPGVWDLHHLGACGSFFSGHSGFSSAIIQLGFTAFSEWIGILSSDVQVVVMDLARILCFGGGVSEFTLNVSHGAAFHRPVLHLYICSFFFFVEGKPLTLIHTVNAAKPSFPTSIVGIVTTCFGWAGQGSSKQEGLTGIHEYTWRNSGQFDRWRIHV